MKTYKLTKKQIKQLEKQEYKMLLKHPAINLIYCYPHTKQYKLLTLLSELIGETFDDGYNTAICEIRNKLDKLDSTLKEVF